MLFIPTFTDNKHLSIISEATIRVQERSILSINPLISTLNASRSGKAFLLPI